MSMAALPQLPHRAPRALLLLLCLCACAADAHILNMTRVTLALDTERTGTLEVQIDLGQSLLTPEEYLALARAPASQQGARLAPILERLTDALSIEVDGIALPRVFSSAEFVADSIDAIRNPLTPQMATLRWTLPATEAEAEAVDVLLAESLEVPWPCLVRVDSSRRELPVSRLLSADRRTSGMVDLRDGGARDAAAGGLGDIAVVYGWLGIEHIVPKGMDHMLFILGLFLVGGALRELLILVSCFTVAHTITLGASTLGVIALPASIVEPLIAASIVYVGLEALFGGQHQRMRYAIVFAFGLLHGLGFASVLREIGLPDGRFLFSLLSFNVGVEIGQLIVLGAAFLLLGALRGRAFYDRWVATTGATFVAGAGTYWLIQLLG